MFLKVQIMRFRKGKNNVAKVFNTLEK